MTFQTISGKKAALSRRTAPLFACVKRVSGILQFTKQNADIQDCQNAVAVEICRRKQRRIGHFFLCEAVLCDKPHKQYSIFDIHFLVTVDVTGQCFVFRRRGCLLSCRCFRCSCLCCRLRGRFGSCCGCGCCSRECRCCGGSGFRCGRGCRCCGGGFRCGRGCRCCCGSGFRCSRGCRCCCGGFRCGRECRCCGGSGFRCGRGCRRCRGGFRCGRGCRRCRSGFRCSRG